MTLQREKVLESSKFIKSKFPKGFKPKNALILEKEFKVPGKFKILSKIDYSDIPPGFEGHNIEKPGKLLFARSGKNDLIVMHGRFHYYDGISMRDLGHVIYSLKELGIKNILSLDEVGHLNPRFKCGGLALIYDHINLMASNPLIGENDDKFGFRFPDMSAPYDEVLFNKMRDVMNRGSILPDESIYVGTIGPASETEAEARFYREIHGDVTGFSLVPENITAVHAGMKFTAIGLITRELVADRMAEDRSSTEEREKKRAVHLKECNKKLNGILPKLIREFK